MILPSDFPHRFFNPLTSKHREDYRIILHLQFGSFCEVDGLIQTSPETILQSLFF